MLKPKEGPAPSLSKDELARLVKAARDREPRRAATIVLMANTGIRLASAAELIPRTVPFLCLRHGTATLLLAAGVADRVVVEIMGHADTRILRRYQDVVPELMRDAATGLSALLAD